MNHRGGGEIEIYAWADQKNLFDRWVLFKKR